MTITEEDMTEGIFIIGVDQGQEVDQAADPGVVLEVALIIETQLADQDLIQEDQEAQSTGEHKELASDFKLDK